MEIGVCRVVAGIAEEQNSDQKKHNFIGVLSGRMADCSGVNSDLAGWSHGIHQYENGGDNR